MKDVLRTFPCKHVVIINEIQKYG